MVQPGLSKAIGTILRHVPLSMWPALVSRRTGVLTPRAIVPLASPAASGGANVRILLDFLDQTQAVQGAVAECGVWRGQTLIAMALYLKQRSSPKTLWGFDSFAGFEGTTPHNFRDTSLQLVEQKAAIFGLTNVNIVPGYFRDSLKTVENQSFSFVHIDCDIYDSYLECLNFFYPRLGPKGVMLFDEYDDPDWPGAKRAVDGFCHARGILLESVVRDNYKKAFVTRPEGTAT
jgi:hypothetical protein